MAETTSMAETTTPRAEEAPTAQETAAQETPTLGQDLPGVEEEKPLPKEFDAVAVEAYLRDVKKLSEHNVTTIMNRLLRLFAGLGVKSKEGKHFLNGHKLIPKDDLLALITQAKEIDPNGDGWYGPHPLGKLSDYKDEVLLKIPVETETKKRKAPVAKKESKKKTKMEEDTEKLNQYKEWFDKGLIDEAEYKAKKAEVMG